MSKSKASGSFVHLHVHSTNSRLDGMVDIEKYVDRCVEFGMPAATLLDHGIMSGAIEFYTQCKAKGINPLIGEEVYTVDDHTDSSCTRYHEGLIAMNWEGYQNIVRLSSLGFTDGLQRFMFPTIDDIQIEAHNKGLICLSGCISSRLSRTIMNGARTKKELLQRALDTQNLVTNQVVFGEWRKQARGYANAAGTARGPKKIRLQEQAARQHRFLDFIQELASRDGIDQYVQELINESSQAWDRAWKAGVKIVEDRQRVFGNRYYLETQIIPMDDQIEYNSYVRELGFLTGIPCVVTADAHYLTQEDADLHRQMLRIRTTHKPVKSEAKKVIIDFPQEQQGAILAAEGDLEVLNTLYDDIKREEFACIGKEPKTTTKKYAEDRNRWVKNAQLYFLQKAGSEESPEEEILELDAVNTIDTIDPGRPFSEWMAEFWVRTPDEMRAAGALSEEMQNTVDLASRVDLEIPINDDTHRIVYMPEFEIPDQVDDYGNIRKVSPEEYLAQNCLQGLRDYLDAHPNYNATEYHLRLDFELNVINDAGFATYFLIVWDYINYVRSIGGLTGPGRGSAAGSLVTFLLGITKIVDPLQHPDLMFERFLTPGRPDLPDIDTDIDMESANKLYDYCKNKYGEDKVCKIATYSTMGARQAIRDFGRVFDIDHPDIQRVSKFFDDWQPDEDEILEDNKAVFDLKSVIERYPELQEVYKKSSEHARWLDYAGRLVGVRRNISQHASAVAISSKPLLELGVPLLVSRNTAKELVTTSQYDMDDMAKLGIPKFDQLKLSYLNIISECERLIGSDFNIEEIPLDDRKTYSSLSKGDNLGIFQVAQSKVRGVLRRVKPKKLSDIAAVITVIRPGLLAKDSDSGLTMEELFLARADGSRATTYKYPFMEEITKTTNGIAIYQEEILKIMWSVGFSPLEADKLRKILSKKQMSKAKTFEDQFVRGAQEHHNLNLQQAQELWGMVVEFAAYGFNSAHAYSYGLIAYWTSYLKTHYPAQFMCSFLTIYSKKSSKASKELIPKILEDCRQMGRSVPILPPNINKSGAVFQVEQIETPEGIQEGIRFGLNGIKGVAALAGYIIGERIAHGPYSNLQELDDRVQQYCGHRPNKGQLLALLWAGALDDFFAHRSEGQYYIELSRQDVKYRRQQMVDAGFQIERRAVIDQRQAELCGNFYFNQDNQSVLGEEVDNFFEAAKGDRITIGGRVIDAKIDKKSRNNNIYHRVIIKTQWGDVTVDFYSGRKADPKQYLDSLKDKLFAGSVIKITGQVRDESSMFGSNITLPKKEFRGVFTEDPKALLQEAAKILMEGT